MYIYVYCTVFCTIQTVRAPCNQEKGCKGV